MKISILAFSDCHDPYYDMSPWMRKFKYDMVIFCGDFCNRGFDLEGLNHFAKTLKSLSDNALVVPGNHDFETKYFENTTPKERFAKLQKDFAAHGVDVLGGVIPHTKYKTYKIKNKPVKVAASCWVKMPTPDWAYCASDTELKKHALTYNKRADILVTHAPPYCKLGHYEYNGDILNLGDPYMTKQAQEVINPSTWLCGHIHESHGSEILYNKEGIHYPIGCSNLSVVDRDYKIAHEPVIFIMDTIYMGKP